MKAYVIKNKEGKYFDKVNSFFCRLEYACCIFYTIEEANYYIDYYGLKDCEVVEITIVEGDLEQQIRADERRKVREEIKDIFLESLGLPDEEWIWNSGCYAGMSLIKEILDKIEKGENK